MPVADEPVTLGEVGRRLDTIQDSLATMAAQMGERPSWRDVQRVEEGILAKVQANHEATTVALGVQASALATVTGWGNWANKLALGAIGAAVLGSVIMKSG